MNVALWKKLLVAVLVMAASGLIVVERSNHLSGQETKKVEKKAKGRLPAYYTDIVTDEQREQIYMIQAKHKEKIAELNATLLAATKAMTAEIESVLSAEQKLKLKMAQDEGAAKKKKTAADKKATENAKRAVSVEAKATTKTK